MSNDHFTPAVTPDFYANPFIGAIPADTADNLIYGCALLRKLDCSGWDHDPILVRRKPRPLGRG